MGSGVDLDNQIWERKSWLGDIGNVRMMHVHKPRVDMATSLQREEAWDIVIGWRMDQGRSWKSERVAIKKIYDNISGERSWIVEEFVVYPVFKVTVIKQSIRYEWVRELILTHVRHSIFRRYEWARCREVTMGTQLFIASHAHLIEYFSTRIFLVEPFKFFWEYEVTLIYFRGQNDVDCHR